MSEVDNLININKNSVLVNEGPTAVEVPVVVKSTSSQNCQHHLLIKLGRKNRKQSKNERNILF